MWRWPLRTERFTFLSTALLAAPPFPPRLTHSPLAERASIVYRRIHLCSVVFPCLTGKKICFGTKFCRKNNVSQKRVKSRLGWCFFAFEFAPGAQARREPPRAWQPRRIRWWSRWFSIARRRAHHHHRRRKAPSGCACSRAPDRDLGPPHQREGTRMSRWWQKKAPLRGLPRVLALRRRALPRRRAFLRSRPSRRRS